MAASAMEAGCECRLYVSSAESNQTRPVILIQPKVVGKYILLVLCHPNLRLLSYATFSKGLLIVCNVQLGDKNRKRDEETQERNVCTTCEELTAFRRQRGGRRCHWCESIRLHYFGTEETNLTASQI